MRILDMYQVDVTVDNGNEAVDHPSHYNYGKIETIDYIEDVIGSEGLIDFCIGNALKYISRCRHKGKFREDLKKAIWYLQKAIEQKERGSDS